MNHGTHSAYTHLRCRCADCRSANAAYASRRIKERRVLLLDNPSLVPHGTDSTYNNYGCRCDPCRAAKAAVNRDYHIRVRRVAS